MGEMSKFGAPEDGDDENDGSGDGEDEEEEEEDEDEDDENDGSGDGEDEGDEDEEDEEDENDGSGDSEDEEEEDEESKDDEEEEVCVDVKKFIWKVKKGKTIQKKCAKWVTKKLKKNKNFCNKKTSEGIKIGVHCPVVCGSC